MALEGIDKRRLLASPVHEQMLWVDYMTIITKDFNQQKQALRKAEQAQAKIRREQQKAQDRLQRQDDQRLRLLLNPF